MAAPIGPINDWLSQYDAAEFVWTIVGICAMLGLLWAWAKRAIPAVDNALRFIKAFTRLPVFMQETSDFISDTAPRIETQERLLLEVRHEVLPNKGGSLRDDVETVTLQLQEMKAHQVKDYASIQVLQRQISARRERRTEALSAKTFPHDTSEDYDG